MHSHAAQIQALLAREREEYARWGRLARSTGSAGQRRPGDAEREAANALLAAQAPATRRGAGGASARA